MGVRQLQTFIQKHVPKGYLDVSLIDECEEFNRQHETRPILLIKLNGLLRSIVKDQKEIFCGIRHNIVHEKFENVMKKLCKIADIIFFIDGLVCDAKMPNWIIYHNKKNKNAHEIESMIDRRLTLQDITDDAKELISPTSPLKFTESLAQKYGELITSLNRDCNAEMVQIANQNRKVLAILDDDSDFLIYRGKWKYYSLRDMNQGTLDTKEYNRHALRAYLNLNDQQMILLSTLNGNTIVSYDTDTYQFHKTLLQNRNNKQLRFPSIAAYIRDHNSQMINNNDAAAYVAREIYKYKPEFMSHKSIFINEVQYSIDFYDTKFEQSEITDETQIFCREESLNFVRMVLNHKLLPFTLDFFDQQREANYFESINDLFSKQIGIIFNFKSFDPYKIWSKLSINDPEYSIVEVIKSLPRKELSIPLIELLDRSNYPDHDQIRFKLLKWLISEKMLQSVDLELIPQNLFLDILVLVYMVKERFINVKEADIILLSIKHVEDGIVPDNITAPETLNPRAFYASILFSKCHIIIARCLEVTGLKKFEKIHKFDGVLFHNLFLEHIDEPFDASVLLGDLAQYRYYA
jgi:hypothetical protein